MNHAVVGAADHHEIFDIRLAAIHPFTDMMHLAPGGFAVTPRVGAAPVARGDRFALGQADTPAFPTEVEGLARPGGNVTGLSTQHADTAGKRLSLLSEIIPGLRRVAVMANTGNTGSMLELQEALKAAPTLGLEIVQVKVSNGNDIPSSITALRGKTEALYVTADALFNTNRDVINALALEGRLPTSKSTLCFSQWPWFAPERRMGLKFATT